MWQLPLWHKGSSHRFYLKSHWLYLKSLIKITSPSKTNEINEKLKKYWAVISVSLMMLWSCPCWGVVLGGICLESQRQIPGQIISQMLPCLFFLRGPIDIRVAIHILSLTGLMDTYQFDGILVIKTLPIIISQSQQKKNYFEISKRHYQVSFVSDTLKSRLCKSHFSVEEF